MARDTSFAADLPKTPRHDQHDPPSAPGPPLIAQLIRDLAEYEKLRHEVRFDEATLERHLFGPHPMAEVVIGQVDGTPQGFALFFHNFSTFEGRPGIYLEDLYVRPRARIRAGQGTAAPFGRFGTGSRLRKAGMERSGLERTIHRILPQPWRKTDGTMDRHAR
jgi:hypothetical protein